MQCVSKGAILTCFVRVLRPWLFAFQCVPIGRHLLTMMHETTTWRIEVKDRLMIAHGGTTLTGLILSPYRKECAARPHFLDRLAGFQSAYGDDNGAIHLATAP